MKWTRHGLSYVSDCERVTLVRARGHWWIRVEPEFAPNGIELHPADTLKQAKAIAEAAIIRADKPPDAEIQGLHAEIYKRLSDGERYRAALEAIRMRCEESEAVDGTGLKWLVEEALR